MGVSSTATAKEIKSAYRKRALELHPDVNKSADASTRFNEVKEAYNVLIDPKLRAAYDDASSYAALSFGSMSTLYASFTSLNRVDASADLFTSG